MNPGGVQGSRICGHGGCRGPVRICMCVYLLVCAKSCCEDLHVRIP